MEEIKVGVVNRKDAIRRINDLLKWWQLGKAGWAGGRERIKLDEELFQAKITHMLYEDYDRSPLTGFAAYYELYGDHDHPIKFTDDKPAEPCGRVPERFDTNTIRNQVWDRVNPDIMKINGEIVVKKGLVRFSWPYKIRSYVVECLNRLGFTIEEKPIEIDLSPYLPELDIEDGEL